MLPSGYRFKEVKSQTDIQTGEQTDGRRTTGDRKTSLELSVKVKLEERHTSCLLLL